MIEESLHKIQQRMADAMASVGRTDTALLVAVTKNHPVTAVEEVARLGCTHVGENRVQEAKEKQMLYTGPKLVWHLIGHLQVNKVRQAVPMFDLIHSVDSKKLLDEIEKVAAKHGKVQDILLQVVEDFPDIRDYAKTLPHVRVKGLMCMAPFFENPEDARPIFRVAHALYEDMKGYFPDGDIQYLSMGMTHDFEIALQEGANIVRVGTAIFGERVYN